MNLLSQSLHAARSRLLIRQRKGLGSVTRYSYLGAKSNPTGSHEDSDLA